MTSRLAAPLEQFLADRWNAVEPGYKVAFLLALAASALAFGFEATNLTTHHDDVHLIFRQDTELSRHLGRFSLGWVHLLAQNGYVMPFLQMVEAAVLAALYGLLIARLWGLRQTLDVAAVAIVMCVFPYMAQIYQYNVVTVPFALAHFLAAAALVLSIRASVAACLGAVALYVVAFSVYQAVVANAATIFVFWFLSRILFKSEEATSAPSLTKSTIAVAAAVLAAGVVYTACVLWLVNTPLDHYQGADKAFSLHRGMGPWQVVARIAHDSRAFFFRPQDYFPDYLKKLQLVFVAGAVIACLFAPLTHWRRVAALAVFTVALLAPRTLQMLHPEGDFHNLTLTSYAVVIAGSIMLINRSASNMVRSASVLLASLLIAGYVIQSNWISTVNHLNTLAHYANATQILGRVRSISDPTWDGKTVVVAGSLRLYTGYPFRKATGVAPDYLDAEHLQNLARLMRDDLNVIRIEDAPPAARELATQLPAWPNPSSTAVVSGKAVIVLSK